MDSGIEEESLPEAEVPPCYRIEREQIVDARFDGHYLNTPTGGSMYSGGYADLAWSGPVTKLHSISFYAELEEVFLGLDRFRLEFEIYDSEKRGTRIAFEGPTPLNGTIAIGLDRPISQTLRVYFYPPSDSGTASPLAITVVDQNILIKVQETYRCD